MNFKIDLVFGQKCEVYTDADKIVDKYNVDISKFENIDGRALHIEKNGFVRFVIYLGVDTYKTIAHEASHISDYVSEHFNINNKEFRAYLVGHIVDQIIYKLNKKHDKY